MSKEISVIAKGKDALLATAGIYKQLYIDPKREDAHEQYSQVVRCGQDPESTTLSHFVTNPEDTLEEVDTPAGSVKILTLNERADFETFSIIMAHRCVLKEIPKTQGASTLDGLINWRKIDAHKKEFLEQSLREGKIAPDWDSEFMRFTSDKSNYLDVLILLSKGPYSNIPGQEFGISDDEWLNYSHTIRKYHECTHFICRRLYPEKIDAIWDELVADTIGIYAAFSRFDLKMICSFLGISEKGYTGGRIKNYIEKDETMSEEEYKKRLDSLAGLLLDLLKDIKEKVESAPGSEPFDLIDILENNKPEGNVTLP